MRITSLILTTFMLFLAEIPQSKAHSRYKSQIPNAGRVRLNGVLVAGLGHENAIAPSTTRDRANPFGLLIKDTEDQGGDLWQTACNEDSDLDGFTNGQELCDPGCVWTPGDDDPVDCLNGTEPSHPGFPPDAVVDNSIPTLIKLHAAFMLFAWAFCAPAGILAAVFFKNRGAPPTWFTFHKILLSATVSFTLFGFIIIYVEIGELILLSEHPRIGLSVIVMATFQALNGFARPHLPKGGDPKSILRSAWELLHQWNGRASIFLAWAALITGIELVFDNGREGGVILASIFGVLAFAVIIYKSAEAAKGTNTDDKSEEMKHDKQDEEEVAPQVSL